MVQAHARGARPRSLAPCAPSTRTAPPAITRSWPSTTTVVAGAKRARHRGIGAVIGQDLDRHLHRLAVLDHKDEGAVGTVVDRIARHHQRAGNVVQLHRDIDQLARHQRQIVIGESRAQFDGAALVADDVADEVHRRAQDIAGPVAHIQGRQQPAGLLARLDARQIALRQGEGDLDRPDFGDRDQRRGGAVGAGDHVARLDQDRPGLAVDRRADLGDSRD